MKINLVVKVDAAVKQQAKQAARELGLPMSTVVNALLREFTVTRTICFTAARLRRRQVLQLRETVATVSQQACQIEAAGEALRGGCQGCLQADSFAAPDDG